MQRINGVPNAVTASGPTPDTAPEFRRFHVLARNLRSLQLSGDVVLGYRAGAEAAPLLAFSEQALASPAYAEIVGTLDLTPGRRHYPISVALSPAEPDTIALQTRSLNGVLYYLSHAVTVPQSHQARGLVTETRDSGGLPFDWSAVTADLFRIRTATTASQTAAVSVSYRGYFFYIDDADLASKSTFSLLAQLFALRAGTSEGLRPVLTIPVGGLTAGTWFLVEDPSSTVINVVSNTSGAGAFDAPGRRQLGVMKKKGALGGVGPPGRQQLP